MLSDSTFLGDLTSTHFRKILVNMQSSDVGGNLWNGGSSADQSSDVFEDSKKEAHGC